MKKTLPSPNTARPSLRFQTTSIAVAVAATFSASSTAFAQNPNPGATSADATGAPAISAEGSLSYTGGLSLVGVGVDQDGRIHGQASHVLHEESLSAWIAQAWLGNGGGGLRLDYNWIAGQDGQPETDGVVRKMFAALDRNRDDDRKFTVGLGLERENWSGSLSYATGLSDQRWVGPVLVTDETTQQSGTDAGKPYIDTTTTTTYTRFFERAYRHGVGMRVAYFAPDAQIRVTAGADHEWSDEFSAKQDTLSLGVEKFFTGSPHSLGLSLDQYRKSGDFETDTDGTRFQLTYRFSLGGAVAPQRSGWRETVSVRQVEFPAIAEAAPVREVREPAAPVVQYKTELRIVKTTASMTGDTFFELDKAVLTDQAKAELDHVAQILATSGHTGNIRVTGHTCDLGSDAYNLKLSLRRAVAVRDYLAERTRLAPEIFVTEGLGEAQPKYPFTRDSRAKNRRVELEFIQYQDKTEEVRVPVEPEAPMQARAPAAPVTAVLWKTEIVEQEPAWVRRALRSTIPHKQTVDTYRGAETARETNTTREVLNTAPVARDDHYVVGRSGSWPMDVLANDSDPDGDTLRIVSFTQPSTGVVTQVGNSLSFLSTQTFVSTQFTYSIDDGYGGISTATVIVVDP